MNACVLKNIVELAPQYLTAKEVKVLRKQLLTIYLNEEIKAVESSDRKSVFLPEQNLYRAKEDHLTILRKQLAAL